MFVWLLIFIVCLLFIEVIMYVLFLLIKALKIFIEKNSEPNSIPYNSKELIRRFVTGNMLVCILVILISFGYRIYEKNNIEYILEFNSRNDVNEVTKLLEKNNLDYKVLIDSKKILINDGKDAKNVISILNDNNISYHEQ